ncbi:GlxA family transcriptional regulator [Craterilacuibacter sp.]|uniref:GlxA family transcriptional regulator n=1 Tax=Craterilacuibacter sp. TaxID=2870909 RepID=UPI003F32EF88
MTDLTTGLHLRVLLLPGFSETEAGIIADCITGFNARRARFTLHWVSADGKPVPAASGRLWAVDGTLGPDLAPSALLLVLASEVPAGPAPSLLAALTACARQGGILCGVNAGVFWLAAAGLYAGQRVCVHWSLAECFAERYPALPVLGQLYALEGGRASCAGGVALADCLLHLIARLPEAPATGAMAETLLLERQRRGDERQRMPLLASIGAADPKLVSAVQLMEANLEEPLTTDEIAALVCISRRQLERLFRQYLDRVPSQYYLELRLERSRQQLRQSGKSIIQIGLSCGFSSGPHFSSAFRNHFGHSPRDERRSAQRSS